MKHLLLAIALICSTCMAAFGGEGSAWADNEAAMKQGRTALTAKIGELEQTLASRNIPAAEAAAADVLKLMQKGMTQTRAQLDLSKREDQKAVNARYLQLESSSYKFRTLTTNVSANGKQLLEQARSFMKLY